MVSHRGGLLGPTCSGFSSSPQDSGNHWSLTLPLHIFLFWNIGSLSLSLSESLCVSLSLFLLYHLMEGIQCRQNIHCTTLGMVEVPTLAWFLILKLCLKAARDLLCSSHPRVSWCHLIDTESQSGHKWTLACLLCPMSLLKSH